MKNSGLLINFSSTVKDEALDYYFKYTIRRAVNATLVHEGFDKACEISITFCDNKYIRKLNKEYRAKDKATDVLSFPMYDLQNEMDLISDEETVLLGDIVISLERAREQAKELGNTFLEEVAFLTVHSMLHLLGYDHELSPEDDEAQCKAQREIVATLDI